MSGVGPIDVLIALRTQAATAAGALAGPSTGPSKVPVERMPVAVPTAEAREAVERGARATKLLHAVDRDLAFVTDPSSGELVGELRDGSGTLLRTLPVHEALDLLDALGSR